MLILKVPDLKSSMMIGTAAWLRSWELNNDKKPAAHVRAAGSVCADVLV